MSREAIPNILIRLTNVTGFDHSQGSNLAFKLATDEIERLLAQAWEPMECGHPKACFVTTKDPAHEHYLDSDLDVHEPKRYRLFDSDNNDPWCGCYCSACAELEKARASEGEESTGS